MDNHRKFIMGLIITGIISSVILTGIFIGCGTTVNKKPANDKPTLKIGALLCLSGECAAWGNNSIKGLELAKEEINNNGGVLGHKIELISEDTKEGEGGLITVTAFHNLLARENIQYYIGPSWTPGGLSVAPIVASRPDLIMISPSLGVADFNEAGDNLFNVWPHDEYTTKALARYAFDKGFRRVAILSSQQPWVLVQGNIFEKEFIALGGSIAKKEEPLDQVSDFKIELMRIKQTNPDLIFIANIGYLDVAAKQIRRSGLTVPLMTLNADTSHIKSAQGTLEGTIVARYPSPQNGFVENFKTKFKQAPDITADTAYDALYLYAKAATIAQTLEPQRVKEAMLKTELNGASGQIVFDDKGGVIKSPTLYLIKGEGFERL